MTIPLIRLLAAAALLALLPYRHVPAADGPAGVWAGRMEPGTLSAELTLTLHTPASASGGWTCELLFHAGADHATLRVSGLSVESERLRISSSFEGAAMVFALALQDGLLLGTVEVREGGRVLVAGPVGLAPTGDAAAQQRLAAWLGGQGITLDGKASRAVVERALELFAANYVLEDKARQAVAALRAKAEAGELEAVNTAAHLAEVLSTILADATNDKHVRVKFSTETYPDPLAEDEVGVAEAQRQFEELRAAAAADNYGVGEYALLEGGIGYLPLTRFYPADIGGDALAAAMVKLNAAQALVIDLRECRGGDPEMVALVASWLFPPPARHWNDMQRRFDGQQRQYWTAAWLAGPRFVDKPVYVLTAQRTFSAPEGLAYELQQTGRATIVGETTGGGAHPGAWFPLGHNFALFIPLSRYISPVSGTDWEGVGVVPDVPCPAAEALDRARALILLR